MDELSDSELVFATLRLKLRDRGMSPDDVDEVVTAFEESLNEAFATIFRP